MKRYLLEHRLYKRKVSVYDDSFQSACHAVGWYPADTVVLRMDDYNPCAQLPSTPREGFDLLSPRAAESVGQESLFTVEAEDE